ncbi:MAG: hypothetical protein Kow0089_10220 [Desulfobulbaceae bacterium]
MNIFITNHCPRKCSFCFARTRIGLSADRENADIMSLENVRRIMDFLEASDEYQLRLLGGEPTTHPAFLDITREAVERGFRVQVFTNGMLPPSLTDELRALPEKSLSFLCNVSPQARDTTEQKEQVRYFLKTFNRWVQLGVTLTGPALDYRYLIEAIERYDLLRRIRVGIAQPIVGPTRNSFLATDKYRETGKFIVSMARECVKKDILLGFDCGLTLCMFDEEEIGVLTKCADGFRALCDPIIDVGPDLDVWHCFPMAETLNTRLELFRTRRQIVDYYKKLTLPYRQLGCMKQCVTCVYRIRGQCTGGCLAHAMNGLDRYPPRLAPDPPPSPDRTNKSQKET